MGSIPEKLNSAITNIGNGNGHDAKQDCIDNLGNVSHAFDEFSNLKDHIAEAGVDPTYIDTFNELLGKYLAP